MIKIEMNKGHINDCVLEGSAMDFTADLAVIFQIMCEAVSKDVPKEYKEKLLDYFEKMCVNAMHRAKEFAKCTSEDKVKKVLDLLLETMKKSKATDSDDIKASDFTTDSTDLCNFLFGEEEE